MKLEIRFPRPAPRGKGGLLLPAALFFLGSLPLPAQPPGKTKAPRRGWMAENWVMAIVNDKAITWRDVRSRIPLTAVEIWKDPNRLEKEKDRILRELATSLLLREAIYTLPYKPAQLDQFLDKKTRERMKELVEKAGGMKPFLDNLKKMGITYKEREKEIRDQIQRTVFLQEKLGRSFQDRTKVLLLVRPSEMLKLFNSPQWKDRRIRPACAAAEVFILPREARKEIPKLLEELKKGGSKPFRGKLPEGVVSNRMLVLDCPSLQVGWAAAGIPLAPWEKDFPAWSREDLDPQVAAFLFSRGPLPRISPPQKTEEGFRIVRVLSFHPRKALSFTDPAVQEELRRRLLDWKEKVAQFQLLQGLWRQARIWPPKLKRQGPPGVPSPWD